MSREGNIFQKLLLEKEIIVYQNVVIFSSHNECRLPFIIV
jgi:hypothetical protein